MQKMTTIPAFGSPDAALSEELLQQVVRRFHHEDVVQGHEDAADFSEPSHQAELVERAHRLDRLERVGADHLERENQKTNKKRTKTKTIKIQDVYFLSRRERRKNCKR